MVLYDLMVIVKSATPRAQLADILRRAGTRVLDAGGLVYRTHGLGYTYVRSAADGSANTSQVNESHFLTKTTATYPGLLRSHALGTAESAT